MLDTVNLRSVLAENYDLAPSVGKAEAARDL